MSYPDNYHGEEITVGGTWSSGLDYGGIVFTISVGGNDETMPSLSAVQAIVAAAQAALQDAAGESEVTFTPAGWTTPAAPIDYSVTDA